MFGFGRGRMWWARGSAGVGAELSSVENSGEYIRMKIVQFIELQHIHETYTSHRYPPEKHLLSYANFYTINSLRLSIELNRITKEFIMAIDILLSWL